MKAESNGKSTLPAQFSCGPKGVLKKSIFEKREITWAQKKMCG